MDAAYYVSHNNAVSFPEALAAIRAWYRLDRAFEAVNRSWRASHGVTGEQVAVLRIVAERDPWPYAELRSRLSMHPATLGQLLARLEEKALVSIAAAPDDARRRHVTVAPAGTRLLAELPLVGPVRLRTVDADPAALRRLTEAFDEAVELFGLTAFAPDPSPTHRKDDPR